ncbi:DNA methyltransferase [Bacillus sp. LL01]|uniref:N-6 DNA methylase n=1 Tax=Bacillus sp. LL01 TaxID=1665556 RepID=UPI00064CEDC9|nr:N-6 DNA methylase [Bacillus sp. LL01]KMJ60411.1 DNA methyltransferase [Bacillus sp. LL01]
MGRHAKILEKDNIDKRELGYYYTPKFISSYISKRLLMINPNGNKVLDPCVGQEELLEEFFTQDKIVDGIDVYKYKEDYRCNFRQKNFIEYYREIKVLENEAQITFENLCDFDDNEKTSRLDYDYIIANPPYNCHEVNYIKDNKKELQELFDDVGVHNMYSMFISAIIDLAKDGALIGLITYDSFFTSKAHTDLRKKILNNCAIHEVTMCSNDLFHSQAADVRTSIIILQKGKKYQGDVFVSNRPISKEAFQVQLEKQIEGFSTGTNKLYHLSNVILSNPKDNNELIIECPDDIKLLFMNERLGGKFNCVTGISTGKDLLYLSKVKVDPFIIPFYKNPGKNKFFTDNNLFLHKDFLKFDSEIKNFMVRNKHLLYKPGITCSSMGVEFTASRLPENSTFGVNANIICEDKDAWWLLAYLNSELVTYLVRGILNRSNMITSGYVSRIPLINISEQEKTILGDLSKKAYEKAKRKEPYEEISAEINTLVNKIAGITDKTISNIKSFTLNLIKNT